MHIDFVMCNKPFDQSEKTSDMKTFPKCSTDRLRLSCSVIRASQKLITGKMQTKNVH